MTPQPGSPHSARKSSRKRGRHAKKKNAPHGPPHVDEKWLVSYSDMMTLLFGLFVMLFSIASEKEGHKGGINAALKSIADAAFNADRAPDSVDPNQPKPPTEIDIKALEARNLSQEIAMQEQRQAAREAEEAQAAATRAVEQTLAAEQQRAEQMAQDLEEARQAAESAAEKIAELEEKTKQLEALAAEQKVTTEDKAEEKPSTDEKPSQPVVAQTDTKKLEEEIKRLNAEKKRTKSSKVELEAKIAAQENEVRISQTEVQRLRKDLADALEKLKKSEIAQGTTKNIFVVARWSAPDFDIDLELKDPNGKQYNFNNRSFATNKPGFFAGSEKGPGAEMIKITTDTIGKYQARVKVYNARGSKAPVSVELFAVTPDAEVKIKEIKLDGTSAREQDVDFSVNRNGQILTK